MRTAEFDVEKAQTSEDSSGDTPQLDESQGDKEAHKTGAGEKRGTRRPE